MKIDPEVSVMELLESFNNGNIKSVVDALADDHPGLTAMFLVTGIGEKMLDRSDANTITNMLMDRRIEMGRAL